MTITFTVVTDERGFRELEADWRALSATLDASQLFQTFDWCWTAWRCIAAPRGRRLRILVGRVDGKVVTIWPLMIAGPFLRMLGSDLFELHDVLMLPGPQRAEWLAAALNAARRLGGAALLLRDIRADAQLAALMQQRPRGGRSRIAGRTRILRLDRYADWDSYFAALPKQLRSDQRRQWRRLLALPAPAHFEMVTQPEARRDIVRWLHAEKTAWLEARGVAGGGEFGTAAYRDFLENIVATLSRQDMALTCRLCSGDATLAALLGFMHRGCFVFFIFAYAAQWASYSPGRLIMGKVIEWCMQHDMRTFDMLVGEEDYKSVWADSECAVEDHLIPLTTEGRAIAAWHASGLHRVAEHPWIGAASRCMPARLRRAIASRMMSHAELIADMRQR